MDMEETGSTFRENAIQKATWVAQWYKRSQCILTDKQKETSVNTYHAMNVQDKTITQEYAKSQEDVNVFEDIVVVADDSGLEIDALQKEPGIYSARYLGENTSYKIKNENLLERMAGVAQGDRSARFVCAIAAVFADGETLVCEETVEGEIAWQALGEHGFGYDPIFWVPAYETTMANLSEQIKNQISHRAKALQRLRQALGAYTKDRAS
jgi:non-canonical purine NTP pyrophosphatase (RdgB/HAM1 family)